MRHIVGRRLTHKQLTGKTEAPMSSERIRIYEEPDPLPLTLTNSK